MGIFPKAQNERGPQVARAARIMKHYYDGSGEHLIINLSDGLNICIWKSCVGEMLTQRRQNNYINSCGLS